MTLRLGINIDHVATVRNARGGAHPDTLRAAELAQKAGADSITIHLREDRRHIRDEDVLKIARGINLPLNFEMAATKEMQEIALMVKPEAVCLVPEKREERTTEGGLNLREGENYLAPFIAKLQDNGSIVSLFIEPSLNQVRTAHKIGAKAIELHTGKYCDAYTAGDMETVAIVLEEIKAAAKLGAELGLSVHAGHGLTYESVVPIAQIEEISELNIGHFLIGEAIFIGLENSIIKMREIMNSARESL